MNSRLRRLGGVMGWAMVFGQLLACLVLGLLFAPSGAHGQSPDPKFFAVGNNAWGATNQYAIVPPVGGKYAVVRTLAVQNDLAPGRIAIYTNGMPAMLDYDAGAGLTNYQVRAGTGVYGTNGFAPSDQVLIHNQGATPPVWRARVAAVGTTNITVFPATAPPWSSVPAGTMIYRTGTNQVLVGITNGATSIYNGFVTVGQLQQPLLIDMITSAAGGVNCVGGTYE